MFGVSERELAGTGAGAWRDNVIDGPGGEEWSWMESHGPADEKNM